MSPRLVDAMLKDDDWKLAIEDARYRHGAVVNLIYFNESQAMGLLRLYATLGVAAASGVLASLAGSAAIPPVLGWGLAGATAVLVLGAWFCLKAMQTAAINLPGRGAECWLWASEPGTDRNHALRQYLDALKEKHTPNNYLNKKTSAALGKAKLCAVVAPVAAIGTGVIYLSVHHDLVSAALASVCHP